MEWYIVMLAEVHPASVCHSDLCQVTGLDKFRASEQKPRTLDTPGATDDERIAPKFEKRKVASSSLQKGKQSVASGEVKNLSQ